MIFLLLIVGIANAQEPEDSDTLVYPLTNQEGGLYLDDQVNYELIYNPVRDH